MTSPTAANGQNLAKKGTIASVKKIAQQTFEVAVKLSEDFNFTPGQYIWLMLPKLKYPDPKGDRRAFSICSLPGKDNLITLIFRTSDSGYKRTLLELPKDSPVDVIGPFGFFALPKTNDKPLVFIAGGTGVTPVLSMLDFLTEHQSPQNVSLLLSNTSHERSFYLDRLEKIQKINRHFSFAHKIGQIDWDFIQNNTASKNNQCLWYIVGPQQMVIAVTKILLDHGVAADQLYFDQHFGFAGDGSFPQKAGEPMDLEGFKFAVDSSPNHIVVTDVNGVIKYANSIAEKITGFKVSEMIGETPRLWGGLMDKGFYENLWQTIKVKRQPFTAEIQNRRKSGELYVASLQISLLEQQGNLLGFVATEEDVSSRILLEQDLNNALLAAQNVLDDLEIEKNALLLANAKDTAMLASIGDGIVATDQNARVIFINEACEKLIGWKKEEVFGKSWIEVVPMDDEDGNTIPDDKRPIMQAISQRKTTTTTTTYYFTRKDKTRFPVTVTATPIILNGGVIGAIGIYRDITTEKEIDKAKSEFVSLASHQLRTPLGIIKWYLEALQNDNYFKNAPTDTRKYFDEIYSSTERVLSLVRDLLSVSRIDQGKVKNVPKPIFLTQTIEEIIDQMQIVARNKKVTLRLTIEDSVIPPITIDILRFHEAIENLITNALEYSLPESLVEVTLTKNDDTLLISVKDTGLGISKADLKLLFTKFFRSDEAIKHNPEGSGLGLYVVKSYVEGWGGKLAVQSEPGKGSTFTISLPIKQV